MLMETIPVLDDFHYIMSRLFDRIEYYQTTVIYNRLKASRSCVVSDKKITDIANLLRQKENVNDE